jgi:acyl-CoA-binding protein
LRLVALTKQASVGAYNPKFMPEVGMFDVVGNDRKKAWQALGDTSKEAAMGEFISSLDECCNLFRAHVEAHLEEKKERERRVP